MGGRSKVYLHLQIFEVKFTKKRFNKKLPDNDQQIVPSKKRNMLKGNESSIDWDLAAAWRLGMKKGWCNYHPSRLSACFFLLLLMAEIWNAAWNLRCINPGGWDMNKIKRFWMFVNPSPKQNNVEITLRVSIHNSLVIYVALNWQIYASQTESCNPKSWDNDDQIFESTI